MFVSSSSIHPHEPVRTLKVGVRARWLVCGDRRGKQWKKVRDGDASAEQPVLPGPWRHRALGQAAAAPAWGEGWISLPDKRERFECEPTQARRRGVPVTEVPGSLGAAVVWASLPEPFNQQSQRELLSRRAQSVGLRHPGNFCAAQSSESVRTGASVGCSCVSGLDSARFP